nr:type II toxin-antitoxin system VapC family toxin [Gammaproteobacteria bacterium]
MRFAYFDTCVTIYYVERNPDYFSRIEAALFSNEEAAVFPVVSDLTRLECRVFPLRTGDRDLLDRYDTFFGLSEVRCANIGRRVFDLATELRAGHGLQTPDALHLAAAINAGCDELWTNDRRLEQAAEGRLSVVSLTVSG